jgi:CRP-like cAMP-binding protein
MNYRVPEAKKFLHCSGIFVQCDPGDIITVQGDVSYAYYILISGSLKSLTFHRPIKEYITPGQHFGANGLTEHTKHTEDIAAISFAEILVLSGIAFQKFYHSHPDIAHKTVESIISLAKKKTFSIK